jgi:histidyl-tRNA synthetase
LVGLFGKDKLPGVGLGFGDVTLRNFLETHGLLPKLGPAVDVFVTLPKSEFRVQAEAIARSLRESGRRVMTPLGADSFGAQLKMASKHGAAFAVLLGESELREGKVLVKNLATGQQVTCAMSEVVSKCQ